WCRAPSSPTTSWRTACFPPPSGAAICCRPSWPANRAPPPRNHRPSPKAISASERFIARTLPWTFAGAALAGAASPGRTPAGPSLTCYLPDKRTVLVEQRPPQESLVGFPAVNDQTASFYDIREVTHTRLNRRSTHVITVSPKDEYRYGYRLWIDDSTAMPLKTQLCEQADQPAVPESAAVGSSSAFSTVIDGHKITAVGEVPPDTVRFIASQLKAEEPAAVSSRRR